MALGKVFDMGGLYKGSNRQAEPSNGFRRALNVWQDRDKKWRPCGDQAAFHETIFKTPASEVLRTMFIKRFKEGFFRSTLAQYEDTGLFLKYANYEYIDKEGNSIPFFWKVTDQFSQNYTDYIWGRDSGAHVVLGNKMFFTFSTDFGTWLAKFDGVQAIRAGLGIPQFSTAQYATTGIVRYVRAVAVRIGFDGTLVSSNYIQFPVNNATITLDIADNSGPVPGGAMVLPEAQPLNSTLLFGGDLMDDDGIIRVAAGVGKWVYAAGSPNTLTCELDGAASPNRIAEIGQWIMFRDSNDAGLGITPYHIYAMKVVSYTATHVTFNADEAKVYRRDNLSWQDRALTGAETIFTNSSLGRFGASQHILIYSSVTASGAYALAATVPYIINYQPSIVLTTLQTLNLFAGQVAADLASWYDIGSLKTMFPGGFSTTVIDPVILGMTKYQNLLITYDRNAGYLSDITSGGSDEMSSGLANFSPPGTEYGDLVCMEGCEDFLFISRERKNFVLTGDLATGGFSIVECTSDNVGAFSSRSAIAVNGGILFVSRQGIFFVNAAGTITEISKPIARLWGSSREFVTDPDKVAFKPYLMTDVVPFVYDPASYGWDGNLISLKYDQDRNIVGVMYCRKQDINVPVGNAQIVNSTSENDSYCILAINLSSGGICYEWKQNKVDDKDVQISDFEFLPKYTTTPGSEGKFKGSLVLSDVDVTIEDNTSPLVAERLLLTSWQTAGEPSLEKQTSQIKFYGQMTSCKVFFQENWAPFPEVDSIPPADMVTYPTDGNYNTNLFEHKQRIRTSRAQAISFGFVPLDTNFSMEGYEIEWDVIQGSVKK